MVAWWWVVVAYIAGQALALGAITICSNMEDDHKESKKYLK